MRRLGNPASLRWPIGRQSKYGASGLFPVLEHLTHGKRTSIMQKINSHLLGLVLLVAGGIIGSLGWEERQSIGSTVKSAITGSPSDKAVYMFGAGVILIALGLVLIIRSKRK